MKHLQIAARLRKAGVRYFANDAIGEHLKPGELKEIEAAAAAGMVAVLDALVIDRSDPNVTDTANRVARMFVREVFAGRYDRPPKVVDFPNGKALDELYTLGPIAVRSACAHHLCPVEGQLWVGIIPSNRVIGISKFARIARWVMARPQIQEEAIIQLADAIEKAIKPMGLAVVLRAKHSCMTWRGVKEADTTMTTNVMRGIFKHGMAARGEFLTAIQAQGFNG